MNIDANKFSKLAAVMLLLVLAWLIWLVLISSYVDYFSQQYTDIERSQRKLIALNELILNKKKINFQYRAMKNNRSLSQVFLGTSKGVLAYAKFQGVIKRIVKRSKSTLLQSSLVKNDSKSNDSITMKVSIRSSVDMVYKTLHQIENGWPIMKIDNIELSRINNGYRNRVNSSLIGAVFEVTAYVQ
jgi:hypothetical protein